MRKLRLTDTVMDIVAIVKGCSVLLPISIDSSMDGLAKGRKTNDIMDENTQSQPHSKMHWFLVLGICGCLFVIYLIIPDRPPLPSTETLSELTEKTIEFSYQKPDGSQAHFPTETNTAIAPAPAPDQTQTNNAHANATYIPPPNQALKLESPQPRTAKESTGLQRTTVKSGDSLYKIFSRLGLSPSTLNRIVNTYDDPSSPLKYIYPGQVIDFQIEQDTNILMSFAFDKDKLTKVIIQRDSEGNYTVQERSKTTRTDHHYAKGNITEAFYLSAKKAGLTDKTILALADIFAWDIDFTQDIRANDSFEVLFQRHHLEDGSVEPGKILTARFINRGRDITAIAYTDGNNKTSYYTPSGNNVRKAFLRSPVDFARISSRFNLRRRHPILHSIRAHKGVDYAARRGTPVKATGDGKVILKGRKGGYGKTIILQHGQKYSTLYAHLQGYNKNIKEGSRVTQGQIIGYIGSSGLATGPHLHYEFRVAGVHKNPLTVKFPNAAPIPSKFREDFLLTSKNRLDQLATYAQKQTLARVDDS